MHGTYRMVAFRLWQRSKFGLVEELMMFKRIYVGLTENDSISFFYLFFIKLWVPDYPVPVIDSVVT